MQNLFKKFTPSFQNIVQKYAVDCWYGRESEKDFLKKVSNFRKKFEKEIIEFYKKRKYKIDYKEIQNLSLTWQAEQLATAGKIKANIKQKEQKQILEKKEEILKDQKKLFDDASKKKPRDFTPVIKGLTAGKMDSDFLKKSKQIGDQSAFDFITEINNLVVKDNSENFDWTSQKDNKVRKTHKKLNGKTFSWNNLPKIDSEEVFPGSQWGCRCMAVPSKKKALKNYSITTK